jgi:hypothetical protein
MSVTQQNIPQIHNGDQVIMFTGAKSVKTIQGYQDLPSMYSWYSEDPDKNHLGLMSLWGQQAQASYPMYRELLQSKSVIEVNGFDGGFTYDIPVKDFKGVYTTRDMSFQAYPGLDGGEFKIVLSTEYTTGDILSNDVEFGQQIVVSGSDPVQKMGDGFEHTVKLVDNDKETWFMAGNLSKGISYFKLNHVVFGESGTNFSHVDMIDTVGKMRCEFNLGSIRGVEAYVTGMADKKSFSGATAAAKDYINTLAEEASSLGELAVLTNTKMSGGVKKPDMSTARIGTTMEFLVHRELEKLTAQALLFQKAGTIRDSNGTARLNEGLWHQLRRGTIIKYGRPGGITRNHLKEAAEYIFRANPDKPIIERKIKFRAGKFAYQNILAIIKDEVQSQNAGLNAAMLTAPHSTFLPKSPVSGTDLMNLGYDPIRFTRTLLGDIGHVEVVEDTSLNQQPMSDRLQKGMHPGKVAHTAYSLVIWDVEDQQYSNNAELPTGTKLIKDGTNKSNIFLVKPEGEMTYWGSSNGRYNVRHAGDIVASHKQMGQEFWAYNSIGIWVRDLTKFIMIELDERARKGFN